MTGCASSRATASRPSRPSGACCCREEPRHPALRVEEPGALDLLLDGGRLNQSHHGMAQSGPLDARAARLANALAGNPPGTTLIESTLSGPTFLALRDVVVGAAGRGLQLHVDDEPVGQDGTHSTNGTAHQRKGKERKPAKCRTNHRAGNRAGRAEQPGGKEKEQEEVMNAAVRRPCALSQTCAPASPILVSMF